MKKQTERQPTTIDPWRGHRVVLATAEAGFYTGALASGLVVHSSVRFERKERSK